MPSGSQVLREIMGEESRLRAQQEQLQAAMEEARSDAVACQQREGEIIRRLAQIRLSAVDHGESLAVTSVDDAVSSILHARRNGRAANEAALSEAKAVVERARMEAASAAASAKDATEKASSAIDEMRERMRDRADYRALVDELLSTSEAVAKLTQRLEEADADLKDNAPAYETDPLFAYLWRRGFGRRTYQSRGLVRALDRWVSRLCNYPDAASRFALLEKLPRLVKQSLDAALARRAQIQASIDAAERSEASNCSAGPLISERDRLVAAAAEVAGRLDHERQTLSELMAEHATYVDELDSYTEQATAELVRALSQASDDVLSRSVAGTASDEDDALLRELDEVRARREKQTAVADQIKRDVANTRSRADTISDLATRFRADGYDDGHFGSGFDTTSLVAGYLAGQVSSGSFWNTVDSSHTAPRSSSDDSSSTFGGDSFGGGGFSGGGSFGGDSFSTGGGF